MIGPWPGGAGQGTALHGIAVLGRAKRGSATPGDPRFHFDFAGLGWAMLGMARQGHAWHGDA